MYLGREILCQKTFMIFMEENSVLKDLHKFSFLGVGGNILNIWKRNNRWLFIEKLKKGLKHRKSCEYLP